MTCGTPAAAARDNDGQDQPAVDRRGSSANDLTGPSPRRFAPGQLEQRIRTTSETGVGLTPEADGSVQGSPQAW